MKNIIENGQETKKSFLVGKILVAMPYLMDSRFTQSVVYICGHDQNGAMGIMINKPLIELTFLDLLRQVSIIPGPECPQIQIYHGGPIDISRGFVMHSHDYHTDTTVVVDSQIGVTSTLDILRAIARNNGPKKSMVCLGYAGWTSGQIEQEINDNDWIIMEPTMELIFETPSENKWRAALSKIGVDPSIMSLDFGHA
jgi:putative transcriptional regulator